MAEEQNQDTAAANETESTTAPPAQPEPDSNDPLVPPEFVRKMRAIDIIALPFCEVPYTHDQYEQFLIALYRKKWGFLKVFVVYYLILSPVLWPSFFRYSRRLSVLKILLRWVALGFLLSLYTFVFVLIASYLPFENFLGPLLGIAWTSMILVHLIAAFDYFRLWRHAFLKIGPRSIYLKHFNANKRRQEEHAAQIAASGEPEIETLSTTSEPPPITEG